MKKTDRHPENPNPFQSEFALDFFDFDFGRSRTAAHRERFSRPNEKNRKNLKNEKTRENES